MTKRIILILALITLVFGGLWLLKPKPAKPEGIKAEMSLPTKELTKKIKNDDFFVYFYQPECSFCSLIEPSILKTAKDTGTTLYFTDLFTERSLWDSLQIEYTPTIVYYKDGKEAARFDTIEEIFTKEDNTLHLHTELAEELLVTFFEEQKES